MGHGGELGERAGRVGAVDPLGELVEAQPPRLGVPLQSVHDAVPFLIGRPDLVAHSRPRFAAGGREAPSTLCPMVRSLTGTG
jgi:hypothetical protein